LKMVGGPGRDRPGRARGAGRADRTVGVFHHGWTRIELDAGPAGCGPGDRSGRLRPERGRDGADRRIRGQGIPERVAGDFIAPRARDGGADSRRLASPEKGLTADRIDDIIGRGATVGVDDFRARR